MSRATRIGITGKIGSGKSTLSAVLREEGIDVVDTDSLAKELMQKDTNVKSQIIELLGAETYEGDLLNRGFVASQIFGKPEVRLKLENIVHPAVTVELQSRFDSAELTIAVESALILQTELWRIFDYIVLVESPAEMVLHRLLSSGKLTKTDAEQRLADQDIPPSRYLHVDFTIRNDSTKDAFVTRSRKLAQMLMAVCAQRQTGLPRHYEESDETAKLA